MAHPTARYIHETRPNPEEQRRRKEFLEALKVFGKDCCQDLPGLSKRVPREQSLTRIKNFVEKKAYFPGCVLNKVYERAGMGKKDGGCTMSELMRDLIHAKDIYRIKWRRGDGVDESEDRPETDIFGWSLSTTWKESKWWFVPEFCPMDAVPRQIPPYPSEIRSNFYKTRFSCIASAQDREEGKALRHFIGELHNMAQINSIVCAKNCCFATIYDKIKVRINFYPEFKELWVSLFWAPGTRGDDIDAQRVVWKLTRIEIHPVLRYLLALEATGCPDIPSFRYIHDYRERGHDLEINGNSDYRYYDLNLENVDYTLRYF